MKEKISNLVKSNIELSEKVKSLEEKSRLMDYRVINIKKQNNANFQYQCGINIKVS